MAEKKKETPKKLSAEEAAQKASDAKIDKLNKLQIAAAEAAFNDPEKYTKLMDEARRVAAE
jgi:hypothetical protein